MALRSIDNIHAIFRKIKNSYYIEQISQKWIIDKFENLIDNNFRIKTKLLNCYRKLCEDFTLLSRSHEYYLFDFS